MHTRLFNASLFQRLLALSGFIMIPLLVWTSSAEMFEAPKQIFLKILCFSAAVAAVSRTSPSFPGVLLLPAGIVLAAGLFSSILSPLPLISLFGEYTSYQGWIHWVFLAFFFAFLSARTADRAETRRLLTGHVISITCVSFYALLQIAGLDPVRWAIEGPVLRTFSTSGNALFLGSFLTAALPAVMGFSAAARTSAGRSAGIACTGLVFAALLSTGSRSALIASVMGIAVFFYLMRGSSAVPKSLMRNTAVTVLLILSLGAMLLPRERNPFPLFIQRAGAVLRGEDARIEIWKNSLRLLREAPIAGQGFDSFATLSHRVQTPALWRHVWRGTPEKAHSEPLQTAVSLGIAGFGLVAWLIAVFARAVRFRARPHPFEAGAAAGLVALGIQSLFGFTTVSPQLTALLLAAILASRLPGTPVPRYAQRVSLAILAAGLLSGIHLSICDVALKSSLRNEGRGIESLVALKTPWAEQLLRAGDTLERRWFGPELGTLPVSEDRKLSVLLLIYDTALRANPLHPLAHSSMARIQLRLGNPSGALDEYQAAVRLAPADAYVALEYVQALFAAGRREEAVSAAQGLVLAYPDFAEPYGMIGYFLLKSSDLPRAELYLRKALSADWHGNTASAFAAASNLASILRSSGRDAEAAWAEAQALRYAPHVPDIP